MDQIVGEPIGLGKPTGREWCCGGGPPGEHNVRPADLRTPSWGKGESKGLEPQASRTGAPALAARKRSCSTKAATPVRSLKLRNVLPALGVRAAPTFRRVSNRLPYEAHRLVPPAMSADTARQDMDGKHLLVLYVSVCTYARSQRVRSCVASCPTHAAYGAPLRK